MNFYLNKILKMISAFLDIVLFLTFSSVLIFYIVKIFSISEIEMNYKSTEYEVYHPNSVNFYDIFVNGNKTCRIRNNRIDNNLLNNILQNTFTSYSKKLCYFSFIDLNCNNCFSVKIEMITLIICMSFFAIIFSFLLTMVIITIIVGNNEINKKIK